ncbi:hypothetical protein EON67_08110 [archaeon]|nr:MAG: hypothetical protein EON67_08110 [archaeon]
MCAEPTLTSSPSILAAPRVAHAKAIPPPHLVTASHLTFEFVHAHCTRQSCIPSKVCACSSCCTPQFCLLLRMKYAPHAASCSLRTPTAASSLVRTQTQTRAPPPAATE